MHLCTGTHTHTADLPSIVAQMSRLSLNEVSLPEVLRPADTCGANSLHRATRSLKD